MGHQSHRSRFVGCVSCLQGGVAFSGRSGMFPQLPAQGKGTPQWPLQLCLCVREGGLSLLLQSSGWRRFQGVASPRPELLHLPSHRLQAAEIHSLPKQGGVHNTDGSPVFGAGADQTRPPPVPGSGPLPPKRARTPWGDLPHCTACRKSGKSRFRNWIIPPDAP